jgi:hypothetical protein
MLWQLPILLSFWSNNLAESSPERQHPHFFRRQRVRRILAGIAALVSAFWIFYTVRLLVVTAFLTRLRAGGGGARIGAVAFPVLAVVFGWAAWRLWRGAPTERA